jgi:hypothetical protein
MPLDFFFIFEELCLLFITIYICKYTDGEVRFQNASFLRIIFDNADLNLNIKNLQVL